MRRRFWRTRKATSILHPLRPVRRVFYYSCALSLPHLRPSIEHKRVPCVKASTTTSQPPSAQQQPPALAPIVDEEDEHRYVVSIEQFGRLRGNKQVTDALKDRRLQELLKSIDSSPQPDKALADALQNPDFEEFIDELLRTIGVRDAETGECLI